LTRADSELHRAITENTHRYTARVRDNAFWVFNANISLTSYIWVTWLTHLGPRRGFNVT